MAIVYAEREEGLLNPDEKPALNPDDSLYADEAAEYLGVLWGRPFTTKDFNNLRVNARKKAKEEAERRAREEQKPLSELFEEAFAALFPIEPARSRGNNTMWRRGDLDVLAKAIDPPKLREEVRGTGKRKSRG
jgi:hypothetical protein